VSTNYILPLPSNEKAQLIVPQSMDLHDVHSLFAQLDSWKDFFVAQAQAEQAKMQAQEAANLIVSGRDSWSPQIEANDSVTTTQSVTTTDKMSIYESRTGQTSKLTKTERILGVLIELEGQGPISRETICKKLGIESTERQLRNVYALATNLVKSGVAVRGELPYTFEVAPSEEANQTTSLAPRLEPPLSPPTKEELDRISQEINRETLDKVAEEHDKTVVALVGGPADVYKDLKSKFDKTEDKQLVELELRHHIETRTQLQRQVPVDCDLVIIMTDMLSGDKAGLYAAKCKMAGVPFVKSTRKWGAIVQALNNQWFDRINNAGGTTASLHARKH
jgi:hypothetical protein